MTFVYRIFIDALSRSRFEMLETRTAQRSLARNSVLAGGKRSAVGLPAGNECQHPNQCYAATIDQSVPKRQHDVSCHPLQL